ncbi:MAG: RDD family protein [Candidatus Dormiibacterota bacterium]
MAEAPTLTDEAAAPLAPSLERLQQGVFPGVASVLGGLVRFHDGVYKLGPLPLLAFSEPRFEHPAWVWDVRGGLLAAEPGGRVRVGWNHGQIYCRVESWRPRLPPGLYRLFQVPFHHAVTRIGLLQLRGRTPSPGIPAEPARRLLAGLLDFAACVSVVGVVRPRRPLLTLAAMLAATQVGLLAWRGQTPGGWMAGTRVVSVDGRPIGGGQALIRLLAMPLGIRSLRDRHDELAGTEVVLTR